MVPSGVGFDFSTTHLLNLISSVRKSSITLKYDRLYGGYLRTLLIALGKACFPGQGRFFQHPNLEPKRSVLSVSHESHFLVSRQFPGSSIVTDRQQRNGSREGHWTLHLAAAEGGKIAKEVIPMTASHHIRCFVDLIR